MNLRGHPFFFGRPRPAAGILEAWPSASRAAFALNRTNLFLSLGLAVATVGVALVAWPAREPRPEAGDPTVLRASGPALRARLQSEPVSNAGPVVLRLTSEDLLPAIELRELAGVFERDGASARFIHQHALGLALRCRADFRSGDAAGALRVCTEMVRVARDSGRPETLVMALRLEGLRRSDGGAPAQAVELLREALRHAEALRDDYAVAVVLNSLGVTSDNAGAVKESGQYYLTAQRRAAAAGAAGFEAIVTANIGLQYYDNREYPRGLEWLQRARGLAAQAGNERLLPIVDTAIAGCLLGMDRIDDAARATFELRRRTGTGGLDPKYASDIYRLAARVALARRDFATAEREARSGLELSSAVPFRTALLMFTLVDALIGQGQTAEASQVVDELIAGTAQYTSLHADALARRAELLFRAGHQPQAYALLNLVDMQRRRDVAGLSPELDLFMRAQIQADTGDAETAYLREQSVLSEARAEQARWMRNAAVLLGLLGLAIALLAWRYYRYRIAVRMQDRLTTELAHRTHEIETLVERRRTLEIALDRKARLEAIGRLAGGMAHDFNNLMAIVMQCSDLLRRRPAVAGDGAALELVQDCREAAHSGAAVTGRLLAFAREQQLHPQPVRLDEFLESARPLLVRATGEGRRCSFDIETPAPAIRVEPGQLVTALINLLANARDATQSDGRIGIAVRRMRLESRSDAWPTLAAGDWVEVAVADDGVGMDASRVEGAVEPFYSTKPVASGAGLGLSVVQGFVVQSGGDLRIDSVPGGGTTVRLLFPEDRQAAAGGTA